MMPTTPNGTRTWRSSRPLGRVEPRTTSPTGSGSAATSRRPAAIARDPLRGRGAAGRRSPRWCPASRAAADVRRRWRRRSRSVRDLQRVGHREQRGVLRGARQRGEVGGGGPGRGRRPGRPGTRPGVGESRGGCVVMPAAYCAGAAAVRGRLLRRRASTRTRDADSRSRARRERVHAHRCGRRRAVPLGDALVVRLAVDDLEADDLPAAAAWPRTRCSPHSRSASAAASCRSRASSQYRISAWSLAYRLVSRKGCSWASRSRAAPDLRSGASAPETVSVTCHSAGSTGVAAAPSRLAASTRRRVPAAAPGHTGQRALVAAPVGAADLVHGGPCVALVSPASLRAR